MSTIDRLTHAQLGLLASAVASLPRYYLAKRSRRRSAEALERMGWVKIMGEYTSDGPGPRRWLKVMANTERGIINAASMVARVECFGWLRSEVIQAWKRWEREDELKHGGCDGQADE